jgi:hypothetical protein
MLMPSTKQEMTWPRRSVESLFILNIITERSGIATLLVEVPQLM